MQVGFECLAVLLHEHNQFRDNPRAEQGQFTNLAGQRLVLLQAIPFADNGLQRNVGLGHARADLRGRANRLVELLPAFLRRPGWRKVLSGGLRDAQRPPFFDIHQLLKMGLERPQESKLPIVIMRQLRQQRAQAGVAIPQSRQLADE